MHLLEASVKNQLQSSESEWNGCLVVIGEQSTQAEHRTDVSETTPDYRFSDPLATVTTGFEAIG